MSLYDVILKELDLNEGDEFRVNTEFLPRNYVRKFCDGYLWAREVKCNDWIRSELELNYLLNPETTITITKRAQWVPKVGEMYFMPYINDIELYDNSKYRGDSSDLFALENKLMFKTKEEAIACAKKMLDVIKEDRC